MLRLGFLYVLLSLLLVACTPAFVQQEATELAGRARLLDSVDIQRSNQRLLARQAQVCLVGDFGQTAGPPILQAMQRGFTGYFAAVGVDYEPMDYLRAVASAACPGASYLFFVQPHGSQSCGAGVERDCSQSGRFSITIVSRADQALVDRVVLTAKRSFIPGNDSDMDWLQRVFTELAARLTGAETS